MNRRRFLASIGALSAPLAGCLATDGVGGDTERSAGPLDPVTGSWPTYQFDSGRTGYNPEPGTLHEDRSGGWTVPLGVSGTPAVADGTVYVGSIDGFLVALDASTGEETWRYETGAERDATFWATPVPSDETLFAHSDAGIHALDLDTGDRRWHVEPEVETLRPRTMVVVDRTVVVERGRTAIAGLDVEDGEERWRYDLGDYALQSPLAVTGGTLYVTAVDNSVHAVDPLTGERRWRRDLGPGGLLGLSVADGTAYLTSHVVYAVDTASGDLEWSVDVREAAGLDDCPNDDRQSGSGGSPASQPAVAGGRLFLRFESCHVLALEVGSGEVAWTARVPGPRLAPVVVGDRLYVTGAEGVVALDPSTGEQDGPSFATPGRPSTAPVVVDGVVLVGAGGRDLDALVASTG